MWSKFSSLLKNVRRGCSLASVPMLSGRVEGGCKSSESCILSRPVPLMCNSEDNAVGSICDKCPPSPRGQLQADKQGRQPHQHQHALQELFWWLEEVRLQLPWMGLLRATTLSMSYRTRFPQLQTRPCSPGWWLFLESAQKNLLRDAECCQQCNAVWLLAVGEQSQLDFGQAFHRSPVGE